MIYEKTGAPASSLANTVPEVEAETLITTLVKVKAEAVFDALAFKLEEEELERPSEQWPMRR